MEVHTAMRIKVGGTWYDSSPGQPIMVFLEEIDKENISSMHPEATRYAEFHSQETMSIEEKMEWMEAEFHSETLQLHLQLHKEKSNG